jgi:hypothetical protein
MFMSVRENTSSSSGLQHTSSVEQAAEKRAVVPRGGVESRGPDKPAGNLLGGRSGALLNV